MELTKTEVELLKALKELGEASGEELVSKTGINADGVNRSLYFLSEKGLVELETNKEKQYELTEEGEKAFEKLPEEMLREYDGKVMRDIPNELRGFVGKLKEKGLAEVDKGTFKIKGDLSNYWLRTALKKAKDGKALNEEEVKELLRRNYVKEKKILKVHAKITEEGRRYELSEEGQRLTKEMLENGSWKGVKFKSYVVKPKDIKPYPSGVEHPINKAIEKIRQVFLSMGFKEMYGNYVEESFWNFDALYQPQDHPSRELADTFFLPMRSESKFPEDLKEKIKEVHEKGWHYKWKEEEARKMALRTHTTVLSARTLWKHKRGKFFAIGRVFRNEAIDYRHLAEFHQVEGIIADKNVNFRHLLGILKTFYAKIGFPKVRFRPSYFPYTEPSLEIEVWFEPKKEWLELGGAGIFRREVVEPLGAEYPVLAFGLSLERPLMLLLAREDIRDFYTNDIDFLENAKEW